MQSEPKPAVLSVGRLYCDLIFTGLPRFPTLGTEVFADDFGLHAGGGAFITAAHLSALGHPTSLATMLPSSPFSDLIRPDIEAANIDLSLSATLPEAEGPQLTVAMAQGGDRAFLTRRAGPAFPKLAASDLAARQMTHLHIGELTSLVTQPEIIDTARANGMTISLDCGWDDALEGAALRLFAGKVDLFLPNEAEWARVQEMGLADQFAPLTVVKQGPGGATAISAAGRIEAPTHPIEALDTTGAGDAFNAGFLSSWLMGSDLASCLASGNVRGALSLRRRGGFPAETASTSNLGVAGE